MYAAPSAVRFGWPRALEIVKMWSAWVAASAAGGLLNALVTALAFGLSALLTAPSQSAQAWWIGVVVLLTSFFVAAGIAALPQALLLGRGAAPRRRRGRALGWMAASAVGGLLFYGYLMYDNTSRPNWDDLIGWYLPVTLVVGELVAGAQGVVLRRVLSTKLLLVYLAVTAAGWAVGWSVSLLYLEGAWVGAPRFWGVLGPALSYAVPMTIIGAASGLVLAPALARQARGRALPASSNGNA